MMVEVVVIINTFLVYFLHHLRVRRVRILIEGLAGESIFSVGIWPLVWLLLLLWVLREFSRGALLPLKLIMGEMLRISEVLRLLYFLSALGGCSNCWFGLPRWLLGEACFRRLNCFLRIISWELFVEVLHEWGFSLSTLSLTLFLIFFSILYKTHINRFGLYLKLRHWYFRCYRSSSRWSQCRASLINPWPLQQGLRVTFIRFCYRGIFSFTLFR